MLIVNIQIFAMIFEKIIFTSMFEHFTEIKLFTVCQSGSLKEGSCPSKLLSIIHNIKNHLMKVHL